jgi:hypothetical protein
VKGRFSNLSWAAGAGQFGCGATDAVVSLFQRLRTRDTNVSAGFFIGVDLDAGIIKTNTELQ